MHHTFTESVSLGIMCNLMVCLALWMSYCGRWHYATKSSL